MPRTVKTKRVDVAEKPGRQPFVDAYNALAQQKARTWEEVEPEYLHAMQAFDELVVAGVADQGDIQNGKGDFLNDVLALLLENCSEKRLHRRGSVPGLSFRNHSFDVAYPATGLVALAIETKATGIPRHPRNQRQKHPEGRAGSADLEKRIKEASFKNIDIKAEIARREGRGGGPTSDLGSWMRMAPPRCYMFISARVRDAGDLQKCNSFAQVAATWFDACGLYCYGWNSSSGDARHYEPKPVVATALELDRVLANVCTALRHLPQQ